MPIAEGIPHADGHLRIQRDMMTLPIFCTRISRQFLLAIIKKMLDLMHLAVDVDVPKASTMRVCVLRVRIVSTANRQAGPWATK